MISIKSEREIELMRTAGEITSSTHKFLKQFIKPGITTRELDKIADDYIISRGAISSCKNYNGYPASICVSVNEEVVHGIPSSRKLKDGDIVSIDISACYKGYHGDSASTYAVGNIDEDKKYLLKHTEEALFKGIDVVKPGIHVGAISNAIEEYAKKYKLGVVKELVGHGIGSHLHEAPDVPNYGSVTDGPILKAGMTIAIEPMLNFGTARVLMLDDDWTIVTADNKPSAHFEHTVLVTDNGYEILTKR